MHEIRNKLYDENEKLTSEELDILNFETDFNRTYDAIYDNSILDDFIDGLWLFEKGEKIIQNPKNKEFFRKLYEETGITIVSDRELATLYLVWEYHGWNLQ